MPTLMERRLARRAGQAATVTLTAAAAAGANPTKAEFDKVVADVAALRTALRNAGLMA